MTLREIYIKIDAQRERSLNDFKLSLRVGYENAHLQRVKRFPKWNKYLKAEKPDGKKMKKWFDEEIERVEKEGR